MFPFVLPAVCARVREIPDTPHQVVRGHAETHVIEQREHTSTVTKGMALTCKHAHVLYTYATTKHNILLFEKKRLDRVESCE